MTNYGGKFVKKKPKWEAVVCECKHDEHTHVFGDDGKICGDCDCTYFKYLFTVEWQQYCKMTKGEVEWPL